MTGKKNFCTKQIFFIILQHHLETENQTTQIIYSFTLFFLEVTSLFTFVNCLFVLFLDPVMSRIMII